MCPASNSSAGPHVDEHDVALAHPRDQLVAADRVDVLAEVAARGALDLRQLRDRGVAQRQPQRQHLVAGERVAHARALARARDDARGVQRLEVLRGVRGRLAARARELVDRARRLGEQVEQLEPPGAGERLAHQRDRLEQRVLLASRGASVCYSIDQLIACQGDRSGGVFFRQLLNDETACASYLFGCKTQEHVRGRRSARRPGRRLRRAGRGAGRSRSSPSSRRTSRPTTSPGCPRSSSAPARRPTCPPAPGSSSSMSRSTTARSSSSATPSCRGDRHAGPRRRPSRLPRHRPRPAARSPGWS